jgi:Fe-S-cluster containining protein
MPNTHPEEKMLHNLTKAYKRYEQQSKTWIQQFIHQGGKVHCQAGCYHCCNLPIRISLAEAIYTNTQLTTNQQEQMQTRAKEIVANAQAATSWENYFQNHREQIGYCPLLEPTTGACSAYEARPGRCRDTFSAFSSQYCQVGTLEQMTPRQYKTYQQEIRANPATDGHSHYIAALEDIGQNIWDIASQEMQQAWGLEVWGDYWVLTALAQNPVFMNTIRAGQRKKAIQQAKKIGLWHIEIVQIE